MSQLGHWDQGVLWISRWSVWPSSEDWPKFYALRGANGERRLIDDTPGHIFEASEGALLVTFVTLVFQNGWDSFVLTASNSHLNPVRLRLSHDEWAEVQSILPLQGGFAAV